MFEAEAQRRRHVNSDSNPTDTFDPTHTPTLNATFFFHPSLSKIWQPLNISEDKREFRSKPQTETLITVVNMADQSDRSTDLHWGILGTKAATICQPTENWLAAVFVNNPTFTGMCVFLCVLLWKDSCTFSSWSLNRLIDKRTNRWIDHVLILLIHRQNDSLRPRQVTDVTTAEQSTFTQLLSFGSVSFWRSSHLHIEWKWDPEKNLRRLQ